MSMSISKSPAKNLFNTDIPINNENDESSIVKTGADSPSNDVPNQNICTFCNKAFVSARNL